MNLRMSGPTLLLERGESLALFDAAGTTTTIKSGELWITMESDRRDIVLAAGQAWTIDRNGCTLVCAEAPSVVTFTEPVRAETLLGRWRERIVALARRGRGLSRPIVPYY